MDRRALRRASLVELVTMAVPYIQQAERKCPRTGPGRPPVIPDWVLGTLIMVAVLKGRKSKSSQYRFVGQHRDFFLHELKTVKFPARSTYFDRYQRAYQLFRTAVKLQGQRAIREGVARATCVAVDKSLMPARGPVWHQQQRLRNIVPPGVDQDASWSYSEHHGWVYGYGLEVVVTAGKDGVVFPLLAGVETAKVRELRTVLDKIPSLPPETKEVLADSGYDSNEIGERIEWTAEGKRTGRHFLCRQVPPRRKCRTHCDVPRRESQTRRRHRLRREARARHFQTRRVKRLYRRRGKTVEPFNQWFKNLFQVDARLWHRGLNNNRTQLLAAIFCYQLLLRYNHRRHRHDGQIQWILDGL